MPAARRPGSLRGMTFIWFVVWVIADHVGGRAPLRFDPANTWAWTFVGAIALDLARAHAPGRHHHH